MITQPTIPQLLDTMREELSERVLPLIDDPTIRVNVEMVTALLSALSVRTENEVAWMLEEAEAIEAAATELLPALNDAGAVTEALDAHQASPPASMRLSDVAESYQRASELLARLTEAAYTAGDDQAILRVQALIDSRLAIEMEAIGEFVAVGRG
jgi:hypothetical protein